jgi:methyltransferase
MAAKTPFQTTAIAKRVTRPVAGRHAGRMPLVSLATSRWLFTALAAAVAVQRALETRVSRRNAERMLAAGGREHARGQFLTMFVLHTAWLIGMVIEVWMFDRAPVLPVTALGLLALVAGQVLRLLAIRTLGPRWSARVITVPGAAPVTGGIYRYLRHPNYVGVALEIAGLPLVHMAWVTAVAATAANALVMAVRIPAEEKALGQDNAYGASFEGRPRFLPSRRRR